MKAQLVLAADYRVLWLLLRSLAWGFTIWTVVLLLNSILANFPGILSLAKKILKYSWFAALFIGLLSVWWEVPASVSLTHSGWIGYASAVGLVIERAIATVSLVAMIGMLLFLLWFPVRIPRNLAYFSAGFVVYFAAVTFSLLARTLLGHGTIRLASTVAIVIAAACYAYWLLSISQAGETVPTQMSVAWSPSQQEALMQKLEGINEALLHTARR